MTEIPRDGITMTRKHDGQEAVIFAGTDGRKYILRPVDRKYPGRRKPPKYYLLVQESGEKPRYVSGLFETDQEGVLSGDLKDALGVRRMFTLTITGEGAGAVILPGRADQGADQGRQKAEAAQAAAR